MATSGGQRLVPTAMRMIKFAYEKASQAILERLPQSARTVEAELQPIPAKLPRQPINRISAIRQSQSRRYSTRRAINATVRHFSQASKPSASSARFSYPSSRVGTAVGRLTSRAPFASTLRPNLTGGTLCRSAGGYGTGAGRVGGVRYFSHSPAAPAEVVNNVSQAVRAFWLSGQKAHYDGINPRSGEKRYKAVSEIQHKTGQKLQFARPTAPGTCVEFKVNPTITAIGPLSHVPVHGTVSHETCLNSEGLMDMLSVDFARALKDLAAIMNDLKKLSTIGDLPLSLTNCTTLRVRFPGCDADTVESLCRELNISRGIVRQDADFDARNGTEIALLFPFAPSKTPSEATYSPDLRPAKRKKHEHLDWEGMMSQSYKDSPQLSNRSLTSYDFELVNEPEPNPWLSSPSGYSSLHASDEGDVAMYFGSTQAKSAPQVSEYEGVEGIYRFLEECDRAKR